MSRIRVGTWNVHEGVGAPGGIADECVRRVLEERIDLLALQEVPFPAGSRPSPLLRGLAERTPLRHLAHHVLSPAWLVEGPAFSGVAVASRFPIGATADADLPNPRLERDGLRSFDKGGVTAFVEVAGRTVAMTSLHMLPFHRFGRRAEDRDFVHIWENLAKQLTPKDDEIPVIAGDFNTPRRDLLVARMHVELASAISEPTHRGMALDDVVHAAAARRVSARTVATFSDHRLCVVELDLD
ncbi:endonuclease/exonuclease/phosphatase family protein [Nonomuraea sp. NPDC050783]|uniref:endonuclease/exonuclease/phosphatase family protein n=1 Tax=Nonomuraea sp. NPDC050783 TaxID=3154634 RepID=UPI0034656F09